MLLPASVIFIDLGAMSGVSNAGVLSPSNMQAVVLTPPQDCVGSNFQVTVLGATGTSTAFVYVGASTEAWLSGGILGTSPLQCTVTANNGNPVTCSSSATFGFGPSSYPYLSLALSTENSATPADFDNARVLASFVCQ
jgi:hypothetical protein